jgi:DNA mismatch repair protein MutS2
MDQHTFDTLELHALLDLLARHASTPLGRTRARNLRPSADRGAIQRSLDLTTECVQYIEAEGRFGLAGIEDPGATLARLQVEGTILEPRQILELERLVAVGMGLRELFRTNEERLQYPGLAAITSQIPDLRRILNDIHGKVLPGGEIDDNASPGLRSIRHEIQVGRNRVHRVLEGILRQQARAVQDEIITFRNSRFVIPVRTDSRVQVPGVVHGLSSSGQTTYVEPLTVIDQNNVLVRLHEQEEIEIARILLAISEAFRAEQHSIRTITEVVAEIDLCQEKARLSLEFGCVRPQLSSGRELRLRGAIHVLLENGLRQSGTNSVPISFALDETHQVLVISGPNAGGKTVVLKTVGLIALMAQMGLHVPAREAVLPVFDQVYADIGDQQSIAASLSTFTAHLRNIAAMAEQVAPPALLLIDEVGTGTDPEEGAALAIAIVDYFRRAGATTLASTHYNPLKMWASRTPGVLNASVEFNDSTLRPTYRLIVGLAGASSGFEIARRMDVPDEIIQQAISLANPDQAIAAEYLLRLKSLVDEQECLRAALEKERAAATAERAQLDAEFTKREHARRSEFEAALARTSLDFKHQSERLIQGLKDRITAEKMKRVACNQAAQLRRETTAATRRIVEGLSLGTIDPTGTRGSDDPRIAQVQPGSTEPQEGDRVWVKPLSQPGTVDSIHGNNFAVSVGSLTFRAQLEDLQLLESGRQTTQKTPATNAAAHLDLDRQSVLELNVIGMTADEAVDRVDKFLDDAFVSGAESIRIIHGHGKGILRRAIAEHLTSHPQVDHFQLAPPNQGGGGATVADLKK